MGTRSLTLVLTGLLFVASARADLQFTPKIAQYELDGVKFKHLAFSDGGGKDITYSPPDGWDYSGSATKLTLRPPNKPHAEAIVTKIALAQSGVFDAESMKNLAAEALASVAQGSTSVALISQEKNPLMIEGKETFLITLAYILHGDKYARSILFLNRGSEQVRCQLTSLEADFKDLQRAFQGSQCTWQNL
jgi:hypothetical protein